MVLNVWKQISNLTKELHWKVSETRHAGREAKGVVLSFYVETTTKLSKEQEEGRRDSLLIDLFQLRKG